MRMKTFFNYFRNFISFLPWRQVFFAEAGKGPEAKVEAPKEKKAEKTPEDVQKRLDDANKKVADLEASVQEKTKDPLYKSIAEETLGKLEGVKNSLTSVTPLEPKVVENTLKTLDETMMVIKPETPQEKAKREAAEKKVAAMLKKMGVKGPGE